MSRRPIQIDEGKALALLRAGMSAHRVRREVGGRLARIVALARENGVPLPGRPPARPFDEARALELLRSGLPAYKVRREVGAGGMRRIVALARENGVALRVRRTNRALRLQERDIDRLRLLGFSWEQIAARLGYNRAAAASIRRRAFRESAGAGVRMNAGTRRWILRRLRSLNACCGWEDVDSFVSIAADPRRHWLLSPREIELARSGGLLAPHSSTSRPQPPDSKFSPLATNH